MSPIETIDAIINKYDKTSADQDVKLIVRTIADHLSKPKISGLEPALKALLSDLKAKHPADVFSDLKAFTGAIFEGLEEELVIKREDSANER